MDVLKKIPVSVDFGNLIITPDEFTEADLIDVGGKCFKQVDFTVTDVFGVEVDLQNIPVSFSLAFVFASPELD